ncbi:hypothetical protein L7F22_010246 [Adiantum nelumboides]|nr:hypothetical protein [Adiantum nelumboides]
MLVANEPDLIRLGTFWRYSVSPVVHASTRTNLMVFWQDQMTLALGVRVISHGLGLVRHVDIWDFRLGWMLHLSISPVMQSMRRKLCYWSTQHLSLAGRALVANQVLLASPWYAASCWTLHGGVMRQLIRNFLYGGSDGTHDTRARVCWSTVILPTSQGGLAIIDSEMQSRTLLTKLMVRGLFLGNEPWKMLLQSDLATVTRTYGVRDGHLWTPGMRFLFTDAPWTHTGMRQQQLGERTHVDWAVWDAGPAISYGTWCRERLLSVDTLAEHYHIGRGTRQRVIEIESAILDAWDHVIRGSTTIPTHQGWWGYFDENGLAILVKYRCLLFTIAEDQDTSHRTRICLDFEVTSPILMGLAWEPIRVIIGAGLANGVQCKISTNVHCISMLSSWDFVTKEYFDQYGRFTQAEWAGELFRALDLAGGLLHSKAETYKAVKGMVSRLQDRYSSFLTPEEYRFALHRPIQSELKYLAYQYTGVGMEVELEVMDAKPSAGSRQMILERRALPLPPVRMEMINAENGHLVTYIRLHYFTHDGTKKMASAIREGEALGVDGYIFDLRNNPGGVFEESVAMAALWLDCTHCGISETVRSNAADVDDFTYVAGSLPVLIGALQDNERTLVLGEKTFGKGVVQYYFPMDDGSGLKLTVAKYLTPKRCDISKQGGLLPNKYCSDYPHAKGVLDECIRQAMTSLQRIVDVEQKEQLRTGSSIPAPMPYRWLPFDDSRRESY